MASSEITVARILELEVPVSWQECVAIAAEVTTLRVAGPALGQPQPRIDAESCVLTRRGDVRLPHPAESSQPDADVQLLRALLAGREIPADLEQLAYGPPPTHLGDALAMFSRPDRRTDIAAVAMRGLAAEAELQQAVAAAAAPPPPVFEPIDGDLARLRAQISARSDPGGPEDTPADEPQVAAPPRRTSAGNRRVAIVGVVIVAVLAGAGVWIAMRPPFPAAPAVALPGALDPADLNDWHVVGTRGADVELGASRRGGGGATRASATPPSAPQLTVPTPGAATGAAMAPTPETAPNPSSPPTDGPANVEPKAVAAEPPVYSWRSADVTPPEMVLPRMPQSSFPPPDATIDGQFIEVLISENGEVEAVRLRGTSAGAAASYRYAMILAAAKAWQFTPATRDGVPVRYVARVVIDP